MNILLGLTGSVATVLVEKLVDSLKQLGDVQIITTNSAVNFLSKTEQIKDHRSYVSGCRLFKDSDEWSFWEAEKKVLHIELRKWADVLVIAPLSANTLAKMANGICDNLLTCTIRAWDSNRPIVIAPAMNTYMWESPITRKQLNQISPILVERGEVPLYRNVNIVNPVSKTLACGDTGIGALAPIEEIVETTKNVMTWAYPLKNGQVVPFGPHPGAFAAQRKHDIHTGVDLYCDDGANVYAVENGKVIKIEPFTGPQVNMPWWNNTHAILVEGASGLVNYGEVNPLVSVGDTVKRAQVIAKVIPVLKEGKERADIPCHSRSMLHIELYKRETKEIAPVWKDKNQTPEGLLDPTSHLLNARHLFKNNASNEVN